MLLILRVYVVFPQSVRLPPIEGGPTHRSAYRPTSLLFWGCMSVVVFVVVFFHQFIINKVSGQVIWEKPLMKY